jgi:IS5 family transposase
MIQRRYGQRSLFEAVVGSTERLVAGLVDPTLQRFDAILTDEVLREVVVERLAQRRPRSRTCGRPGTPAEVVLRLLALKRLKGWSFDETEREVRASLVYRYVTRVYFERVPDAKTLIRLSAAIGPDGVVGIHRRVVEIARAQGLVRGQRARADTTVVQTNVHYPTDSHLLVDGVRVLTRTLKRIEAATGVVGRRIRDRMRAATRRGLEIGRAARSRAGDARQRLGKGYQQLLAVVGATIRDSERVMNGLDVEVRATLNKVSMRVVERGVRYLGIMLPRVRQVLAQARGRVFCGDTHYPEKILSLFEPHTEAIRKGKSRTPTEFGKLVKIQEAENQIVVDYEVYERKPSDQSLVLPAIAVHTQLFGRPPRLLAGDRGLWSAKNKSDAQAAGVKRVCIPATGRLSATQRAEQRQRWFRRGQRYRTGSEGRISVLKRRDGLDRCRYRGMDGMHRWVGWGVVSNNLHTLISVPQN